MSKSPIKPKKLQQLLLTTVQIEQIQNSKLVYSLAEKQSQSGVFSNKRLLILNTRDKYIGYTNDLPGNIPFQRFSQLIKPKKAVNFASVEFLKSKNKQFGLQIICPGVSYKGKVKKQVWLFVFKNSKMLQVWIQELKHFKQFPLDKKQSNKYIATNNLPENTVPQTFLLSQQKQISQAPIKNTNSTVNIQKKTSPYNQQPLPSRGSNSIIKTIQNKPNEQTYNMTNQQQYNPNNEPEIIIKNPSNQNYENYPIQNPKKQSNRSLKYNQQVTLNRVNQPNYKQYQNNPNEVQGNNYQPQNQNNFQKYSYKSKNQSGSINYNKNNQIVKQEPPYESDYNTKFGKSSSKKIQNAPTQNQYQNPSFNQRFPSNNKIKSNIKQLQDNLQYNASKLEQIQSEDWNIQFYFSKDHIQTMMRFKKKCEQVVSILIDQMSISQNFRQINPIQQNQKSIYYEMDGLLVKIAYSLQNSAVQSFFLDESQIKSIKNQFRNYNYLMKMTQNQGLFRVPLSCLIQYKGFVCLIKALVRDYQQISSNQLSVQLIKLQRLTKIRKQTISNKDNITLKYVQKQNKQSNIKIIYIDNLKNYLPYDNTSAIQNCQFRKQLLQLSQILVFGQKIPFQRRNDKSNIKLIAQIQQLQKKCKQNSQKLLNQLQTLDALVLNEMDIKKELHSNGLNTRHISILYKNTNIQFLKSYMLAQLIACIAKTFLRNHMQMQLKQISKKKTHKLKRVDIQEILKQGIINFLNDILTNTTNNDKIWKILFTQLKKQYGIVSNKQQICYQYFISSFLQKSHLTYDYKFLQRQNVKNIKYLQRQFIQGFAFKTTCYDLKFTPKIIQIQNILKEEPSQTGFDSLVELLQLKQSQIPQFCNTYRLIDAIFLYLANFIPADIDRDFPNQYKHLEIYKLINKVPPTLSSIRLALMAIKWAIKRKQQKVAIQIFENASQLVTNWGGQFHPLLGQFYDFFSLYYLTNGQFQEAITLGKSSLVNTIKIIGTNNLSTAQKYYQLGNIYFKIGKKQESLNHYIKTKDILASNNKTNIPEYGIISLKLALLYLNFGKITQTIDLAFQSLKIFQTQNNHDQHLLQTFQILARAYQITQQKTEALDLSNLCCQKLNNSEDPKIFQRMLKISLYPHLTNLPVSSGKILLHILQNLPLNRTASNYNQAFNYLRKRAQNEVVSEVFLNYLQKIDKLSNDINNKQLIKKHKGLQSQIKSQAHDFLVLLQGIIYMIDESYIIGILKQFQFY